MKKKIQHFTPDASKDDHARMNGLVEALSAYIEEYHGGFVELVSYEGADVVVKMGGACVGCPYSFKTLNDWIKHNIVQFFPEVVNVTAIEDQDPTV